ncbi:unnamed protein product [Hydatigera taeniaeformis]|uniref:Transmembrane protein n=1 Tax=Hydatigena taeniaeformis TaxID=6205 RepID=A0A0R3WXF9_HYDTA|nr:unnamed protein product [Hydatigera taeniaeformis]
MGISCRLLQNASPEVGAQNAECYFFILSRQSDPDSSNLARLANVVRDNTSSPVPSETQPPGVSLAHLSTAFAAGFALGAVVGLFSADVLFASHRLRSRTHSNHLQEQVDKIRRDLDQLRSIGRPSPVAFEVYLDDEVAGGDDDEFFDVTSGLSG